MFLIPITAVAAAVPVGERRSAGCVSDSWYSGAACPGQREGVVSLRSGNYAKGLGDDVAFDHAGRPESSLNEQVPCTPAPLLSDHFQGLHWRRHKRTAVADSCAETQRR